LRLTLDYDRQGLDVEIPDANLHGVLTMRPVAPLPDVASALRQALRQPLGTRPLQELVPGRRTACVVVSDITRPIPYRLLLPPLLEQLEQAGLKRGDILILVATGLHRRSTRAELLEMFGEAVVANWRIEDHVARDPGSHRFLGHTRRGTPVWVDARYLDADLKIITGLVAPHLMAGYSGGRKAICPGLCAVETVRVWHGLEFVGPESAGVGLLEGNPAHEEAVEIAGLAGGDLALSVVTDVRRQVAGLFAGSLEASFRAAVARFNEFGIAEIAAPADIVVTSCGGYPLDRTYYQGIKGFAGARPAVRPGGTILLAAGMREGLGSDEFARLVLEYPDLRKFEARVAEPGFFVIDQWQLLQMAKVARHAELMLYTDGLPASLLARLPVRAVDSVEDGIRLALARHGQDASILVMPQGPYVLPRVANLGTMAR